LLEKVFLRQRAGNAATGRQRGLDSRLYGQIAAVGMAQENQPHNGHEVFVAGVVAVGAQGICAAPEAFLDCFNIL
jgi:hypothetical protein